MVWKHIYMLFPSRAGWTNSKAGPFFFFFSFLFCTSVHHGGDADEAKGHFWCWHHSTEVKSNPATEIFTPSLVKIQVQGKTSLVSSRSSSLSRISDHDSSAKMSLVSWRRLRTWQAKGTAGSVWVLVAVSWGTLQNILPKHLGTDLGKHPVQKRIFPCR